MNDIKLTQEKWNMVLDLKDMVNRHSETINKMAKVINNQAQMLKDLELKMLKDNTNNNFNDIFRKQ